MSILFKTKTQAGQQTAASGLNFQSSCYGKAIPLIYGITRVPGNIIWYGDFDTITSVSSPSSGGGKGGVGGGGGGKGGGGSITYTYSTSFAIALSEGGPTGGGVRFVYIDKNIISPSSIGLTAFFGTYSQSPWTYLTTNHPSEALNYHGIAYAGLPNYNLGNSAQLPNFNFEAYGIYYGQMVNGFDTDPTFLIQDILTSDKYGINIASFAVNGISYDFNIYQNYVRVFDFGVSPAYLEQQACADIFNNVMKNTNSEFVWSGSTLKIIPYGDTSKTANGYTYTAPSAPLYSLGDDDFIMPVQMTRKKGSDVINSISLECLDRSNSYNPATIQVKDQSLIDLYGLIPDTSRDGHLFCDTGTAMQSVQLQLQREQVRNMYTFKTSQRYILLDPMDIVEISDSYMGIVNQWVRIKQIAEDSDGNLTFTCEEYMSGNGNSPVYNLQAGSGFSANYNDSPGNVNTPVIFDAPVQLATQGELETWMAVSGGVNWGGCDVWVSADGNTYKLGGRITGECRQGLLTSTFASGSDPDTINTCQVNLSESFGELLSGTQNDADLAHTLCWVDNELIAYQTAELTSTYNYTLKDYIRRGLYGTTISSHGLGTQFARLDAGIFKYPYDKSQIGKTFYIKFLSFNIYGGGEQSLSDVSPYVHIITGPPAPPNVTGFAVSQNGGATVFTWDAVQDFALKGYDILYGPQGLGINTATFLTESGSGTEMTNASVPTGTWTFYIRARDVTDNFSPIPATFDATIVTESNIVFQNSQEPDWLGNLIGNSGDILLENSGVLLLETGGNFLLESSPSSNDLIKHYTGVLVPAGTLISNQYIQIAAPATPALSQTPGGNLPSTTFYAKITYINAYNSETDASNEASLTIADNNLLVVASPIPESGATGYNIYVGTNAGNEVLQNAVPYAIGSDWIMPTGGLIAGSALPSANNTGWEVFDIFVPDPITTATYTTNIIDTNFNDTLRVYASLQGSMGPGQSGQIRSIFQIDTWLTAGTDSGIYTTWTIGFVLMRYLRARFILSIIPGSVPYITDFTPTADRNPKIQDVVGIIIAPGGTTVTFPLPYHFPPYVQPSNANNTALLINAINETTTTFVCHMFNNSGSDVGGTINYRVSGE